jgi:hypothetical protein
MEVTSFRMEWAEIAAVNIRDRAFPVTSQPARSVGIKQIWGELQTEEGPRIEVLLGIVFRSVVAGFPQTRVRSAVRNFRIEVAFLLWSLFARCSILNPLSRR